MTWTAAILAGGQARRLNGADKSALAIGATSILERQLIVLRTVADHPSLWEAILPDELRQLPTELARIDVLLDDPVFFAPFVPFFDPRMGRPSTPMETYLRLMFLKFRYRLGYESLCREVSDSITWRQFCRIGIDQPVPHPTTLMKLTTRCGSTAVDGLNEALLAKAVEAKVLRTSKIRVDTTVVPAMIDTTEGARIWIGQGVFAHNLTKIATLTA